MSEGKTGFEIKAEERQSWVSLAAIWSGAMICIPCLMIGGLLGASLSLVNVILSVIIGYGIVIVYMCFMGMQGCDTGLPTISMAGGALGEKGSKYIISLLLAIACVGWFGVQSAVCGASFSSMMATMTGVSIPVWLSSIIWGIIMLATAIFGYTALKYLNYIAVPLLIIVLIYAVIVTFTNFDAVGILDSYTPAAPMSLVTGISLVIATFALGGVISGDYSRYAKTRKDVIKSSALGVLPAGLVIITIGTIMSIVTGKYDISEVLTAVGVPAIGLVALILATWTTNVINAYSGGIAFSNLFGVGEKNRPWMTAIAGLAGTLLAAFGIMNSFMGFLSILTAFIPPVAGVVIASYWIEGKGKKENFMIKKGISAAGMISFIIGAAVAYITGSVVPFLIGPINGIVISMIAYVVLIRILPDKAYSDVVKAEA